MELTEQSPAAISTEITVESGRLAERQEQAQPFIPPPQCFFFDNKGQIIWNSIHDLSHQNIIKKNYAQLNI